LDKNSFGFIFLIADFGMWISDFALHILMFRTQK
jgi:hypothetical protein